MLQKIITFALILIQDYYVIILLYYEDTVSIYIC